VLVEGVVKDLTDLTTPLSFLSLGVSLDMTSMAGNRRLLFGGVMCRLVISPMVLICGAILLGFSGIQMCALLILFAAPTAVSSYPMAVAMGADGELAGQMVITTTVCSLLTIFFWVMTMNAAGLL
jgi:predicted permease